MPTEEPALTRLRVVRSMQLLTPLMLAWFLWAAATAEPDDDEEDDSELRVTQGPALEDRDEPETMSPFPAAARRASSRSTAALAATRGVRTQTAVVTSAALWRISTTATTVDTLISRKAASSLTTVFRWSFFILLSLRPGAGVKHRRSDIPRLSPDGQ